MKRPLAVLVAALAAFLVVAATAVVVTVGSRDGEPAGLRMHAMTGPGQSGAGGWTMGRRTWMHSAVVDSEFAYLAEMVAHHREAVTAATELQRSDRPRMRAFGAAIVRTQSAQIRQMRAWLARWYPGRDTDVDYRPMMRDLSHLSGDRLDRAFLQDMVPHHMVAVMMSQQLLMRGVAEHPQVDRLATSIRDGQHAEIFRMQRWLAAWFGVGWRGAMSPGMNPGGQPFRAW